ncbi:hypothetical protein Pelo_6747 [Pelomyxa schiedti]|nr:hypothetical protein Pelo_6747 [Pelomyxa schiedti]
MDVYCATVIEILSCKVPVHVATIIAEMAGVRHWERAMWLYNHIENLRRTPFTVYSFQTERKTLEWLLREMCVFQGELLSLLTSSESDPLSRKSLFATKRRPFSLTLVSSLPPTENESTDRSFSFPLNLPSKANIASEILIFTDLPGYFFISSLETHSEIPIKPTVVKNSQYSVYKIKKEEANFNEDLAIHVKNSRDRYGLYRRRALIALAADLESINQIRKIVMRRRLTELLTQVKVPIIREKRKRIVSSGLDSTLQLPAKVFDYVCGNFLGVGDEHNGVSEEYIIQLGTLLRSATPIVHVASWPSPWTNIFGDNSRLYFKAVQPPERFVEVEGLVTLFKTGIIKIEQWEEDTDKAFVDEIKEYQGTWLPQSVTETEIIVQANVALLL